MLHGWIRGGSVLMNSLVMSVCLSLQPEYYGLSDSADGCTPCDCNLGGSFSNRCDQQTGLCECRPNMIGRKCDQPAPGYFVVDLDFMRYEGEFAIGSVVGLTSFHSLYIVLCFIREGLFSMAEYKSSDT